MGPPRRKPGRLSCRLRHGQQRRSARRSRSLVRALVPRLRQARPRRRRIPMQRRRSRISSGRSRTSPPSRARGRDRNHSSSSRPRPPQLPGRSAHHVPPGSPSSRSCWAWWATWPIDTSSGFRSGRESWRRFGKEPPASIGNAPSDNGPRWCARPRKWRGIRPSLPQLRRHKAL